MTTETTTTRSWCRCGHTRDDHFNGETGCTVGTCRCVEFEFDHGEGALSHPRGVLEVLHDVLYGPSRAVQMDEYESQSSGYPVGVLEQPLEARLYIATRETLAVAKLILAVWVLVASCVVPIAVAMKLMEVTRCCG